MEATQRNNLAFWKGKLVDVEEAILSAAISIVDANEMNSDTYDLDSSLTALENAKIIINRRINCLEDERLDDDMGGMRKFFPPGPSRI